MIKALTNLSIISAIVFTQFISTFLAYKYLGDGGGLGFIFSWAIIDFAFIVTLIAEHG